MDFSGLYQVDHRKKKGKGAVFFKKYFLPFFIIFLGAFFLQLLIRLLLFYPVKLNTNSMEPSLKKGDRVFLVYPHLATIEKGSVIYVQHNGLALLCKVSGIEGDVVQILDKMLYINHAPVKHQEARSIDETIFPEKISHRDNTGEFSVGPRQYFCLNENLDNTQDSRIYGAIPFEEIKGKVLYKKYAGFK